ncbi:MAG: DUF2490 domain-containing protein [Bacteroidota bacterium]
MGTIHSADFQLVVKSKKKFQVLPVWFLLPLYLFAPLLLSGQTSDFGNWMSYMFSGKFNDRWAIVGDYQWRNYNAFTDLQQVMFRNFIQYSFSDKVSIAAGYAIAINGLYLDDGKEYLSENRPTQQLMLRSLRERSLLSLRVRAEQRFIESDPMRFRFRVFGSVLHYFSKTSGWAVTASEEIFWYADGITFDQNRVFIGLSYRFNERLRIETGDLVVLKKSGTRQQLFTQLVHTFNW